jgi:Flp pilus assembly protein TadD
MKILPRRRLIPKWRPVAATLNTVEALSTSRKTTSAPTENADELNLVIAQWRETKNPGLLGEILSFSVDEALREQVIAVGYEALEQGATVTPVQDLLIHQLGKSQGREEAYTAVPLGPVEAAYPFQAPIQRLRTLLRYSPDNTLALLDYAQLQTAMGKAKAAERALKTALTLAPNNRTVLRTLARFYVHTQRPDAAHQLIKKHARTPEDPWLMASEIALADAAETDSIFLGKARRFLVENKKYPEEHLTELSGNIAISELVSGNMKKAREHQRRALLAPNDNVIAQAIDFQSLFGVELVGQSIVHAIESSVEALMLKAWNDVDLNGIEQHAIAWHSQEPFSSRPIQMLSSVYAYRGYHAAALKWIEAGLLTDVNDRGLLINLAFVHASAGNEEAANLTLKRLRQVYGKDIEPFANATEGLLEYQFERFSAGDSLYNLAVAEFDKRGNSSLGAFCRLNQAFLAAECGHPSSLELARTAIAQVHAHPSLDSQMLLKIKFPDQKPASKEENHELRKLSQWVFDANSNTLIEKPGVTSKNAKSLIILRR